MKAFCLGIAIVLGVAGAGPATAAGLPPAAPAAIVAAARSCLSATSARLVDKALLTRDGWRRASTDADGKPIETSLTFMGKGDVLLLFDPRAAKPICFVVAHLQHVSVFGDTATAMAADLGSQGAARPGDPNTLYWFPDGHMVQLALTGKPERSGVRVAVADQP